MPRPASAHRGLDDQREAVGGGEGPRGRDVADGSVAARDHRHAGGDRQGARGGLVAEGVQDLRGGADEGDVGGEAGAGKLALLGEEAVAGVDRVDVVGAGERDDLVDRQVGGDGAAAAADQVGLVGLVAVEVDAVLVAEDRHGTDAQLGGGSKHADGDLAAVGTHQLADRSLRGWHAGLHSIDRGGRRRPRGGPRARAGRAGRRAQEVGGARAAVPRSGR
jgi:hypothetical protein